MLVHLAKKVSSFFVSKGIVKENERQIYDYCFEIMLSTVLNFCSLSIIAIISGTIFETICFIAGFMIVRATAGGYHAETHWGCLTILICSYLIYLMCITLSPMEVLRVLSLTFCVISMVLIVLFSPVEDRNKPLNDLEYILYRRKSYIAMSFLIVIVLILTITLDNVEWGFSVAAGMFDVSLSLVAGTLKNRWRNLHENVNASKEKSKGGT